MGVMASQITGDSIVYTTVWTSTDRRKHQSSVSLAFVRGIHRWQAQAASNEEKVSIWWRHRVIFLQNPCCTTPRWRHDTEMLPTSCGESIKITQFRFNSILMHLWCITKWGLWLTRTCRCLSVTQIMFWGRFLSMVEKGLGQLEKTLH